MSESVWSDGGPAFHSTLQLPGQRGFSLSMLVEYSGGVGGGTASPHVPPADFERAVWTRMVVSTQICLLCAGKKGLCHHACPCAAFASSDLHVLSTCALETSQTTLEHSQQCMCTVHNTCN